MIYRQGNVVSSAIISLLLTRFSLAVGRKYVGEINRHNLPDRWAIRKLCSNGKLAAAHVNQKGSASEGRAVVDACCCLPSGANTAKLSIVGVFDLSWVSPLSWFRIVSWFKLDNRLALLLATVVVVLWISLVDWPLLLSASANSRLIEKAAALRCMIISAQMSSQNACSSYDSCAIAAYRNHRKGRGKRGKIEEETNRRSMGRRSLVMRL